MPCKIHRLEYAHIRRILHHVWLLHLKFSRFQLSQHSENAKLDCWAPGCPVPTARLEETGFKTVCQRSLCSSGLALHRQIPHARPIILLALSPVLEA